MEVGVSEYQSRPGMVLVRIRNKVGFGWEGTYFSLFELTQLLNFLDNVLSFWMADIDQNRAIALQRLPEKVYTQKYEFGDLYIRVNDTYYVEKEDFEKLQKAFQLALDTLS